MHLLKNYLERKPQDMSKEGLLSVARKIIGDMVWNLITAKNITVTISVIKN